MHVGKNLGPSQSDTAACQCKSTGKGLVQVFLPEHKLVRQQQLDWTTRQR